MASLALLFICGCDMHLNERRALHAKHRVNIKRLLYALEEYNSQKGVLPATLPDLQKFNPQIQDIAISDYLYNANGILVKDGSRWLLAVVDPLDSKKMIVGRLPLEVDVKERTTN